MRQQGESELACRFRETLDHMQHDLVSNEDVDLLNTHVYANLSPDDKAEYTDALCLCPTNALVDQINLNRLASSNRSSSLFQPFIQVLELRKKVKMMQKDLRQSFY